MMTGSDTRQGRWDDDDDRLTGNDCQNWISACLWGGRQVAQLQADFVCRVGKLG